MLDWWRLHSTVIADTRNLILEVTDGRIVGGRESILRSSSG